MPATPLRKFEVEVARLRRLCLIGKHSFTQSATLLKADIKSGAVDPHEPIQLAGAEDEAESNAFALLNRLRSLFPRYLREVVFVRMISALEVFFLDVIRDVFLARRDLFHSEQRLELSYGELLSVDSVTQLWSKLINRELRKLQNQGFKEIAKFYRTKLGIDLSSAGVPLSKVEEYHDRRHLLVHRLGRTDEQYRRHYGVTDVAVSVTESYLFDCAAILLRLAAWTSSAANSLAAEACAQAHLAEADYQIKIVVEVLSDGAMTALKREFQYSAEDTIYRLGDLLLSHDVDGKTHALIIGGQRPALRAYRHVLKKLERRGELVLTETRTLRSPVSRMPRCTLPPELLERIREWLPPHPWPRDLHKSVAMKFSISNSQAWAAVGILKEASGEQGGPAPRANGTGSDVPTSATDPDAD